MNSTLAILLGGGIFIILIVLAVALAAYIFLALALMGMAKNKGIENAWLAFIPFGNMFILGKILGTMDLFGQKIEQPELVLPVVTLASAVLSAIPVLGQLIAIASMVITLMAYYQLVERYKQGSGALYVILMIFVAPVGAYLLFTIRDNTPAMVE